MKQQRLFGLAMLASLGLSGLAQADTLSLISIGSDQKQSVTEVSPDDYQSSLSALVTTLHDSTLSVLQSRTKSSMPAGPKTQWMLRDVCVGVGTNFSAGLSHIWSVSFAPRVRFGFSNSTHPKMPD